MRLEVRKLVAFGHKCSHACSNVNRLLPTYHGGEEHNSRVRVGGRTKVVAERFVRRRCFADWIRTSCAFYGRHGAIRCNRTLVRACRRVARHAGGPPPHRVATAAICPHSWPLNLHMRVVRVGRGLPRLLTGARVRCPC